MIAPAISLAALAGAAGTAAVSVAAIAAAPTASVTITVTGLRNAHGSVMACMTAEPRAFPDCKVDPAARFIVVPAANGPVTLGFAGVAPGTYAVSLFHDENGNGRLDKMMMLPREGFGFSRNAPVRFGPPRFPAAAFAVQAAQVNEAIRIRYMF
jgi:uncharacterized protein (DUF2141 family)